MNRAIASNRLFADGFGIISPVADNKTAEEGAINRRVELRIVLDSQ